MFCLNVLINSQAARASKMTRSGVTRVLLALALAWPVMNAGAVARAATAASGVGPLQVLELFQSQGCSSCPPANANLMAIADQRDVLTLSWQVTYWDHLGWKDSFAQPAFTQRQRDYARSLGHAGVWTPQVVINGRGDVVGAVPADLAQGLRRYGRSGDAARIALRPGKVEVSGPAVNGQVYLVRFDPRIVQVPVGAGENAGRTLPHRNIVREFRLLGTVHGGGVFAAPPASDPALKTAILIQDGIAGPILAAIRD